MSVFNLNLKIKKKTVNVGDLDIPLCWIRVGVETIRVLAWPLGRHMPTRVPERLWLFCELMFTESPSLSWAPMFM